MGTTIREALAAANKKLMGKIDDHCFESRITKAGCQSEMIFEIKGGEKRWTKI